MNLSNVNVSSSSKRRSLSLSRYQHHVQRRITITSYDGDALQRPDKLTSQIYRNRSRFHEVEQDIKPRNLAEEKITFRKRNTTKTAVRVDEYQKSGTNYKRDTALHHHDVNIESDQRNVPKELLSIWKTSSSRESADTLVATRKRVNPRQEIKIDEVYPELPAYSDCVQPVHDQVVTPITIQNTTNELIEHKLLLSTPPSRRRNLWKTATHLRRRSTSDAYPEYTWSYFNPGFRFVEDEATASNGDCHTAFRTDENCIFSSYIFSKKLPPMESSRRIR
uniref:Uncharacterized protein n=1 Tax=Setaria digitata TaxID=48799 RepID=A0A915PZL7_9BILA